MWLLPPLLLLVVPGCVSSISGPRSVSGSERDSVTIWCHYDPGYESYKKWWCLGEAWSSCEILLETSGSEQRVQGDRVAIKDDHSARAFAVTVEKLRRRDEGFYWCGIERSGTDLGHQVRVLVGPAKPVTTYPAAPETTYPAAPETTPALASLAPSPPVTQIGNSSVALTGSLIRFVLCNIHLVLLTSVKVPLLVSLLLSLLWLSRQQGDSQGK
uniref:CD300 molecule like family member b n=2 Tax=Molossus molossus TaxID=27622 RepID=A0A7J8CWI1_MOLMO|nr:CD300 molecule like family member b [Molossus molossus]